MEIGEAACEIGDTLANSHEAIGGNTGEATTAPKNEKKKNNSKKGGKKFGIGPIKF